MNKIIIYNNNNNNNNNNSTPDSTPDAESRHLAHPKHCLHTESDVLRIEQSELSHF